MALNTNLVAYYKIDETTGTNLNDEVGTNDMTVTNAAINQTGILGKAIHFDGTGDKAEQGSDTDWTKLSFSFWFKSIFQSNRLFCILFYLENADIQILQMLICRSCKC